MTIKNEKKDCKNVKKGQSEMKAGTKRKSEGSICSGLKHEIRIYTKLNPPYDLNMQYIVASTNIVLSFSLLLSFLSRWFTLYRCCCCCCGGGRCCRFLLFFVDFFFNILLYFFCLRARYLYTL